LDIHGAHEISGPALDPFGLDSSDSAGVRLVERHAARVDGCEPTATLTRTRDVLQFDVQRGACCVTLLVTAEALELRLPTVESPRPYLPMASTRLWKRVLCTRLGDDRPALQTLIDASLETRQLDFVRCRFCCRPTPPEHRHARLRVPRAAPNATSESFIDPGPGRPSLLRTS
jgi:hypothetical protein